jgi:hypothetical protein
MKEKPVTSTNSVRANARRSNSIDCGFHGRKWGVATILFKSTGEFGELMEGKDQRKVGGGDELAAEESRVTFFVTQSVVTAQLVGPAL